ncbi:Helix-turn-helix domain-containing protein [Pararobbsia alpina]|uniref:helix-turn-helix domain-containing protein n=1 Tax=Pararobbsia alpina TaxID=621374 RepID=UPI0039A57A8D
MASALAPVSDRSKPTPARAAPSRLAHERYFSDFASALRYWRDKRGLSQLRLSTEADISQRHISFLESGRSQPSRELILRLGTVLDIPLRQRNVMLLCAGFAPAYQERSLSDPEMSAVKQALDFMLAQQTPYPAIVVDRLWNLVMTNAPGSMFFKWLLELDPDLPLPGDGDANVIRLTLDPAGARRHFLNWERVASDALLWIQREAMGDGPGSEAQVLLDSLLAMPGIEAATRMPNLESNALPFVPLQIRKDGVDLNLFSAITTLGTPHDVTVHELRIETFFPADAATADWFRMRAQP